MEMESVSDDDLIHLDLFSGIGGFALAARWVGGIRTIGFCDVEDYACKTLEKNFKGIPIFRDVRKLHPDGIISRDGRIDFISAGFPCQDLSVAGNQAGIEADRSGLFFEIMRLSDEIYAYCRVRPALVLENVSNILAGDGGSWARAVYGELAVRGYYCEWKVVSASDVGAPHQRKRWWCIAYMAGNAKSHDNQESGRSIDSGGKNVSRRQSEIWSESRGCSVNVADSEGIRRNEGWDENVNSPKDESKGGWRVPESTFRSSQKRKCINRSPQRGLGGMVDGLPNWMDEPPDIPRITKGQKDKVSRLKGLGNAVVPQVAMIPLMRIKEILLSGQ